MQNIEKLRTNLKSSSLHASFSLLRILLAIYCLSSTYSVCAQMPENFRASGIVEVDFFSTDGQSRSKQSFIFLYEKAGTKWKVETKVPGGIRIAAVSSNDLTATIFDTGPIGNSPIKAHLRQLPYPVEGYYTQVPWLAFASEELLATNLALPAVWLLPRDDPRAHIFSLTDKKFAHGLVKQLSFTADQIRMENATEDPLLQREDRDLAWFEKNKQLKPTQADGFKSAVFTVLAYTNVHGGHVPLEFQLETFFPTDGAKASVFHGTITNLMVGGLTAEFVSSRGFGIQDYRFRSNNKRVDYITYSSSDLFSKAHDPGLNQIYDDKYSRLPLIQSDLMRNYVVIPILIVLVLGFLCWFCFKGYSKGMSKA